MVDASLGAPHLEPNEVGARFSAANIPAPEHTLPDRGRADGGDGLPGLRGVAPAVAQAVVQHGLATGGAPDLDEVLRIGPHRPRVKDRACPGRVQGRVQIGEGEFVQRTGDVKTSRAHPAIVARRAEIHRSLADHSANALVIEFGMGAKEKGHGATHVGRGHGGAGGTGIVLAH